MKIDPSFFVFDITTHCVCLTVQKASKTSENVKNNDEHKLIIFYDIRKEMYEDEQLK